MGDNIRQVMDERDAARTERDEAVALLRRTTKALDYQVNDNHPEVLASRAFLSRIDGATVTAHGCPNGPGGNGGRHNMTWRRRKSGNGFYCDYCGKAGE